MAKSKLCPHCGNIMNRKDVICDSCGHSVNEKTSIHEPTTFEDNIIDNYASQSSDKKMFLGMEMQSDFNPGLFVFLLIFVWPFAILYVFAKQKNSKWV